MSRPSSGRGEACSEASSDEIMDGVSSFQRKHKCKLQRKGYFSTTASNLQVRTDQTSARMSSSRSHGIKSLWTLGVLKMTNFID